MPTKKEDTPPKTKRAKMVGVWGKYTFRIARIAAAVHIAHSKLLNFPYDHPYTSTRNMHNARSSDKHYTTLTMAYTTSTTYQTEKS